MAAGERICFYGTTASCQTACKGPVDQEVVYRSPRQGAPILGREPVCREHADEVITRHVWAGAMAFASVEPLAT